MLSLVTPKLILKENARQEGLNKEVVKSTPTKLTKEDQDSTRQQHTSKVANQYSLCRSIGVDAPLCQVHEGLDFKEEELERGGNYSAGK
ncbi:hypothetical protein PIB30_088914 [Stylosanthes scabra]|uniref:Uncharacterized protein n=1 Tax=Stylosanthes scabra TaxID=79078 RepID=A0ABU6YVP1_9FABA|nr:hypothetical protein [Stylosanthes scabra]